MIARRLRCGVWPVALGALMGAAGCLCGHRNAPVGYDGRCDGDPATCQQAYQRQTVHPTLPQAVPPLPAGFPTPAEPGPMQPDTPVAPPPPDEPLADLTAPIPQRGPGLQPYSISFQYSNGMKVGLDGRVEVPNPVRLEAPEPIEERVPPPPAALEPVEPAGFTADRAARPTQAAYRIVPPPQWNPQPPVIPWPYDPRSQRGPVITPGPRSGVANY